MSTFSDPMADRKADSATPIECLRLAGDDTRSLHSVVHSFELADLTAVLVDEILFRCDPPGNADPVAVVLDVTRGEERVSTSFLVQAGRPVGLNGADGPAALFRIEYDVLDLVRELFGPSSPGGPANRRTELRFVPESMTVEGVRPLGSIMAAASTILTGCSSDNPGLARLALRHDSDKWGGLHWFAALYERHLRQLRGQPVRVLEIGIGGYDHPTLGGGSLKMWKHYFPRGLVFGVDLYDKSGLDQQRLHTLKADQSDPAQMIEIAERHGPFDIVIDDGSHINEHVRTTFRALFPHVRAGGLYVIEDLWTSYAPGFGGNEAPEACDSTTLGLVKRLVDDLHYEEQPLKTTGGVGPSLAGMHLYRNIAFLEKGRNAEGGIPGWIRH
ncbi:class I SAM-dependent methyltransferase [Kitasatospora xanthocidica]|uniref:Class I SAM-dependent methyltransferase n=1 Tax=Kitasatospora xanthocidica TaxID=83382 RepID=A0A372ZN90_9ACTN|nr:class I SAM-dependent methyltransferase [Kitasatospora xanthocidica]RGD57316.1 class I SAM-dependent methyltransferase [Kitasatospora xanthocidica]